ncbi:MAG TPA: hypothetical protein VJV78_18790 [Polyangiales bacterium]|nr:hypothetical protein [Polyangiales bacterium]
MARVALKVVAALVLAIPLCFVATFYLSPVWGWFESELGVESIGHAAPAGWCFIATYALFTLPAVGWLLRGARPDGL